MTESQGRGGRLRAYTEFLLALLYFFLARVVAHRGAIAVAGEEWQPLIEQLLLAVFLIAGYSAMGFVFDRQTQPVAEQGLPSRAGWRREAGLGLAFGWGLAVVCVLPLALVGGIAIRVSGSASSWEWFAVDIAFFAFWSLAEEFAFRGYGFQRFAHALGGVGAALCFAVFYAIFQCLIPGASPASASVAFVFGLLLSTAYLRTRALWVSWGINFAWKASRALVFGLAISGDNSHSPVVQGDPVGPFWLTGGGFGQEGSWLTFFVLLAALPVLYRITRELDFQYNAPVLVPGGIPVDIDAAAQRQHEAAMGPAQPAGPALVQIAPLTQTTQQEPEQPESADVNPS